MRLPTIKQNSFFSIALALLFVTLMTRGGSFLWAANKSMVLWTAALFNNSSIYEIVVPDRTQTESYLPPSSLVSFGRIAFAQEDYLKALSYYEQADDFVEQNPIVVAETAVALSRVERFEDAISLYEAKGDFFLWSRDARQAILIAYLHHLDAGQILVPDILPILQELDSQELYTKSLILMEQSGVIQISELPAAAQSQLARFPIESIRPKDERLLNYTMRIVPDLVNNGIWDHERVVNVLQFWIWRYPDSPALNEVLDGVTLSHEEAGEWLSLRAELELRRSLQRENMTPDSIPVPISETPTMISNGRFSNVNYGGLVGWRDADYITGRGQGDAQAAFFMDVDEVINVSPPYALRIDGIWHGEEPGFYGALAVRTQAEGAYILSTTSHTLYQLSGYYRTRSGSEQVSIYMGNPTQKLFEISLPPTSQEWREFNYVDCYVSEQEEAMQFLLRLESSGTVWFDELAVTSIDNDVDPSLCTP